ncbi:MAG: hypothetical protein GXY58_04695 [Planctomycetaceae bacterium]|nr:hypothetical protein [Planctomycetaceae bacterium]
MPISSWRTTLTKLGFKVVNTRKPFRLKPRRLGLEPLEGRVLLTTVTAGFGQNAMEGSQTGYFTVSRDTTVGSLTVMFSLDQGSGLATYGSDFSQPGTYGSVSFSPGQSSVTLNVVPIDDSTPEADESVALRLQGGSLYTLGTPSSASLVILDNDTSSSATVNVAATQNASEPNQSGYYTFTRDSTSGGLTVYYQVDQTASTATAGTDFTSPSTAGSVTFSPGQSSVTLQVMPADDSAVEGTESIVVRVQSGSGYSVGSASSASLSLLDNDTAATVNIAAGSDAAEPSQSGYFTVSRNTTAGSLSVYYQVDQTASTASYSSDFSAPAMSGSVTFSPGQSSVTLQVTPIDDTLAESSESVVVRLTTGSGGGYQIGTASSASVLIADNDSTPPTTVNVHATADAAEPSQSGYFTITRDNTAGSLSVMYQIDQGSTPLAAYGSDFSAPNTYGSVTFSPGQSSVTLQVTPIDDSVVEADESVVLHLQNAMSGGGYILGTACSATLLITSDDVNLPGTVTSLDLVNDNGTSPTDRITSDPTIAGSISNDGSVNGVSIQFDYNGDGSPDGYTTTDSQGDFTHTPSGLLLGPVTIYARTQEFESGLMQYIYGNWSSVSFTVASGVNAPPVVASLALANDTGESDTDSITSDATLTGQVTNDNSVSNLRVEFDLDENGTVDEVTRTDAYGVFSYLPHTLEAGEVTVKARAVEWDLQTYAEMFGDWATLSFTLEEGSGPTITGLRLVSDTGDSASDLVTSDPRITGTVVTSTGNPFGITVEIDLNEDQAADATVLADDEGNFTYLPQSLEPGEVTIQARAIAPSLQGGTETGPWAGLTFTLTDSTTATVTGLHLVNDTGTPGDNITTDPEIAGGLAFTEDAARTTVQFDHNDDEMVDGTTMTDIEGDFSYRPIGLPNGEVTVRARVAEWDVGSSSYRYGSWTSFTFTLETATGTGTDPSTPSATAYDRAVEMGLNQIDTALWGTNPNASLFDGLQIGTFNPVTSKGAGLVIYTTSTGIPQNKNYSDTETYTQTVTTDNGQYTITDTVTTSYVMTVTGNSVAGTFVLDVSIDQSTLYEEEADWTVGYITYSWTLDEPGSYSWSYHASGTYTVTGGIVVYDGTYTSHEEGSSDPVYDETGSEDAPDVTADWSYHNTGHSSFTRNESGSFDETGVTADYSFSKSGSDTYTWDDDETYSDSYSDSYRTESASWDYSESESGSLSYSYSESGHITPTATTGTYDYAENGSDTYHYTWDGGASYSYHDALSDEWSHYGFDSTTDGSWSYSYTEDGSFTGASETGDYSYSETGAYTADWHGDGYDGYDYDFDYLLGAWHQDGTYGFTEGDHYSGDYTYTESGDFTPTETTGDYTWDEGGEEQYTWHGSGTYHSSYSDDDATNAYTVTYDDSESYTYGFDFGEDGQFVDEVATSGSYSFSESGTDNYDFTETTSSNYVYDDGYWAGGASSAGSYSWWDDGDWSMEDSGTFDVDGDTGTYFSEKSEVYGYTFTGSGSQGYNYTDTGWAGHEGYGYSESDSGSGSWTYSEIVDYTPTEKSGLYDLDDDWDSQYSYSGSASASYTYTAPNLTESWTNSWGESLSSDYGEGYSEAGLIEETGITGIYDWDQDYDETYNYSGTWNYDYDYADSITTSSDSDDYSESLSDSWGYTCTESGIYGPGGESGVYTYSEGGTSDWDWGGVGDSSNTTTTTTSSSSSTSTWDYSGWQTAGYSIGDGGSFTEDGDTGYYSSDDWGDGSGDYYRSNSWSGSSSYDGTTSAGNGYGTADEQGSWSWSDSSARSYDPSGVLAGESSHDNASNFTGDYQSQSHGTYTNPMVTSTHDSTSHSDSTWEEVWHDESLWGPSGSSYSHSYEHTGSASYCYADSGSINGESWSYNGNWSVDNSRPPVEWTHTTGTPPTGPVAPPTYSGPDEGDHGSALSGVAGAAGAALAGTSAVPAAVDAAVVAFTAMDGTGEAYSEANTPDGGGQRTPRPTTMAEYDQQLLDYYLRVLQQIMLVADALWRGGPELLRKELPWYDIVNARRDATGVFVEAGQIRNYFPKRWPELQREIAYATRHFTKMGIFSVDLTWFDQSSHNYPWFPGITLNRKTFREGGESAAIREFIHEPMHRFGKNFLWTGVGHGDIEPIAGVESNNNILTSLIDFLRTARMRDGRSLWEAILKNAGPRPTMPPPPPSPPRTPRFPSNPYFLPVKCFAEGTTVLRPSGSTSIERIVPGDQVLAYDIGNAQVIVTEVERVERHFGDYDMMSLSGGRLDGICVTTEHPFFDGTRWFSSQEFQSGGRVLTVAAGSIAVPATAPVRCRGAMVYNLRTRAGTYLVGQAGAVVADRPVHARQTASVCDAEEYNIHETTYEVFGFSQ